MLHVTNLKTLEKVSIIDKIDRVVLALMKEPITDQMQNTLKSVFTNRKDVNNWKNPIEPIRFTFTFKNYEQVIQSLGLLAMSYAHFHGSYELVRIDLTDSVEISSKGYYHYIEG